VIVGNTVPGGGKKDNEYNFSKLKRDKAFDNQGLIRRPERPGRDRIHNENQLGAALPASGRD
jgi:hypothetical protein